MLKYLETILNKNLERAKNPEATGISSKVINEMLQEMEREDCELHSLMILRHGKVAVETYQAPLTRDDPHMVYSVSKSFLATAFGFALEEGLLTKETKFLDIFPDYKPKKQDKYLEKLTIGHLVSMTSGKAASVKGREEKDWLKIFIDAKWAFEPGTDWRYINDNFYVAAAAITRVAKMSVTEYLTPRLFEPLGIDVPVWEKSPTGIEAGGWGLFLKTEDIAKLILCYMNGGKYNGVQVIPEWWTKEATSYQNDNSSSQSKSDCKAGYGYGFWRCAGMENTYRCEGLYSQYAIAIPNYDACVITTSSNSNLQQTLDIIWKYIEKSFIDETDTEDSVKCELAPEESPIVTERSSLEKEIEGKVYALRKPIFLNKAVHIPVSSLPMPVVYYLENRGGNMTDISFKFNEYGFHFSWTEDGDVKNTIPVGMNGTALNGEIHLSGLTYKVISDAHWEDENTLTITIRALCAVAKRILTFKFDGDKITMYPDIYPGLEKKARIIGDTLKNVLKGAYFHAWIDFLVPRIKKILFPKHTGRCR